MKTLLLMLISVLYVVPAYANNTFPATGDAGIGTTSPVAALDVRGSGFFGSDSGGLSGSTGVRIFYDGTAGEIYTYDFTNNIWKNVLLANGGGNVGIGTSSPANLLDIGTSGGIHITSGTPSSTSNALYNISGSLAFNGALHSFSAGQLQCSGSNCSTSTGSATIQYCPYKGNVKTTASQGDYVIPSGCLSATLTSMYVGGVASSSVVASTLYYIYLWNTSGTWVLDAETTGHATDSSTGIEIESGDNTKTLVGMIHTDANKHVMTSGEISTPGDTNTVATWDNRIPTVTHCDFTTLRQITSGTFVEINSENRCHFMSWHDAAQFSSQQTFYPPSSSAYYSETALTLDGTSAPYVLFLYQYINQGGPTAGYYLALPSGGSYVPSEGYHYTEMIGAGLAGNTNSYLASCATGVATIQ